MSFYDVLGMAVAFFSCVAVIKIISDTMTRRRLIEKGQVDDSVRNLFHSKAESQAFANLKWGIVLIGIGLAALLSFWFPNFVNEEGAIGLMFIFAGIGFLTYYFVAPKKPGNGGDVNNRLR